MADIRIRSGRPFYRIDNELAEILVSLGLADYLKSVQPGAPQHPPAGWVIEKAPVHVGPEETKLPVEFVLVRHDGFGGRQVYVTEPAPTRRWVGPKNGESEGRYEMVPSDCPQNVLDEWKSLNGLGDPFQRQRAIEAAQRRAVEQGMLNQPSPYGYARPKVDQ
jgi:hypothetical protein